MLGCRVGLDLIMGRNLQKLKHILYAHCYTLRINRYLLSSLYTMQYHFKLTLQRILTCYRWVICIKRIFLIFNMSAADIVVAVV